MARLAWFGLFLTRLVASVCGESVQPVVPVDLQTFADEETRLPCEFKVQDESKVVQVTWSREQHDGVKEQIITKHMTEGVQEFPGFGGRVRFESLDPFKDSTLLILSTKESDDATYTCHISTFPSGNFEKQIRLTVWRIPIAMLEPVILEEGQTFRVAATCRAVGLPRPHLSWDTDLLGQSQNKSSEDKVITSSFLLHPLRSLNGRKLDCLVWHPALENPQRLSNTLVVHFPPNPEVVGYDQNWSVGRIGAELRCESGGNPRPQNFTWTRKGKGLPEGVSVEGNRLIFTRPLNKTDEGAYECEARNSMGAVRAEFNVEIPVTSEAARLVASFNNLLIIIVGGAAGGLVVLMVIIIILVNRHHRRRNRKLKRELTERKEEINNLSRQTSMRRLNSVSTDPRIQTEECALIRLDSALKNSFLSLEGNSTLCDQKDGLREGEYDSLGRPAIYPSYRSERGSGRRKETEVEREERRRRVESFVTNSTVPLDSDSLHRDQSPPPLSISSGPPREGGMEKEGWGQREGVTEGEEGDCTSNSYQISEALSNHFHYSNGFLRPKPHPNAILLHPRGQII
ncbi:LOW QUALITY PROTEIN: nectin-4 [Colossoma macropomum]|uniref:LOW QUALITY PROTEIN: nectin-4 n=1 Tax=Colossoma macropomum TaxID=42526 RepID=UPI0018652448|nr:LOW QUALITY PROTEIN: nectin-4 [Colossoma macropomum]